MQVTVDNLAAADAGTLLDVAVSRLDNKQGEGQVMATWIRAVLLKHTAYLMSTPGEACAGLGGGSIGFGGGGGGGGACV